MKIRTVIIVAGLIVGILSIHAWAFNENGMSTTQGIGSLIFDGEYYLTAPQNIMNNSYCTMLNHDVSVYGNKVAWAEEWDGDPFNNYHTNIVVYDLETKEYQYINYSANTFLGAYLYKPILTDEYVIFCMKVTEIYPNPNYLVIHSLDDIDAENDVNLEVWGSWELVNPYYYPIEQEIYDANNDYVVWKPSNWGFISFCLSNMTATIYDNEMDYEYIHTASITEDNVAYYVANSPINGTFSIDAMDLETGNRTYICGIVSEEYRIYGTVYNNKLWWQNTTVTYVDSKWDTELFDMDINETLYDTDVRPFTDLIDLDGEWAYPMSIYNDMGIYAYEKSYDNMGVYLQNLTLVNFETNQEYVLETFNTSDSYTFYDRYWTGYNPIRNQMIWQDDNGTYVIATEGGVGVVNIQYLIPTSTEDGLNHINIDKEIYEQQEELIAKDYTLFLFGSFTLLATVVYAIWSIKEIYYEERK